MMAHIRTRKLGRENRYDVCWKEHGRDRSKTFIRRADAEKFVVETTRRRQLGHLYDAPPISLATARAEWRERWMIGKSPSTVQRRDEAWPHIEPVEQTPLVALRPADLEDAIVAAAKKAPRQAQIALQTVKQVLRDAQTRQQRFDPALLQVKAPSYAEREPVFLTYDEVEILAAWSTQPRLLVILALSGLRIGEALALRDTDIDRDTRSLVVQRAARKGVEGRTKTRKRRRVYLCDVAWQQLLEQLVARPVNDKGLVFPSPRGLLWDTDNFRDDVFAKAVQRAVTPPTRSDDTQERIVVGRRDDVARCTLHDLRHSYASLMLRSGAQIKTVADQLGHSDGGVLVLKRYGHLYADAGEIASRGLDRMLAAEKEALAS